MAVTNKCEDYACQLLSACKTTHEVQILLQTRKRDAGKNETSYWQFSNIFELFETFLELELQKYIYRLIKRS